MRQNSIPPFQNILSIVCSSMNTFKEIKLSNGVFATCEFFLTPRLSYSVIALDYIVSVRPNSEFWTWVFVITTLVKTGDLLLSRLIQLIFLYILNTRRGWCPSQGQRKGLRLMSRLMLMTTFGWHHAKVKSMKSTLLIWRKAQIKHWKCSKNLPKSCDRFPLNRCHRAKLGPSGSPWQDNHFEQ